MDSVARARADRTVGSTSGPRIARAAGDGRAGARAATLGASLALAGTSRIAADAIDAVLRSALVRAAAGLPGASSGTQTPAEHQVPFAQSESALQCRCTRPGPQLKGAHVCVWRAGRRRRRRTRRRAWPFLPRRRRCGRRRSCLDRSGSRMDSVAAPPQTVLSDAQALRVPCGRQTWLSRCRRSPRRRTLRTVLRRRDRSRPVDARARRALMVAAAGARCAFFATQAWLLSQ